MVDLAERVEDVMKYLMIIGALVLLPSCEDDKLHCPVCLETQLEIQGEPYLWTSSPREIWGRSGNRFTFAANRYITTTYECVRGHGFEEICNLDDPNCIVKLTRGRQR